MGGYKEVVAAVHGRGAYARLQVESGVHRVQRVPDTEASARIHTSPPPSPCCPRRKRWMWTSNESDLRIDVYRAQGRCISM